MITFNTIVIKLLKRMTQKTSNLHLLNADRNAVDSGVFFHQCLLHVIIWKLGCIDCVLLLVSFDYNHVVKIQLHFTGKSRNGNYNLNYFRIGVYWKRPWCWERLRAGGEVDDRGWDGWMASPTRWTWVWVNSGNWWWTGRPGVLWFMGLQGVGHNWVTEPNWANFCSY